jgi:hypothetical protein
MNTSTLILPSKPNGVKRAIARTLTFQLPTEAWVDTSQLDLAVQLEEYEFPVKYAWMLNPVSGKRDIVWHSLEGTHAQLWMKLSVYQ